MAWRFEPGENLGDAFRRVAAEEVGKIRAALCNDSDRAKGVHEARQGFKRLRALLRLARPSLGARFDEENRVWRDAGRQLSGSRDRTVMLETFDRIAADCALPAGDADRLRAHLAGNGSDDGSAGVEANVREVLAMTDDTARRLAALPWPEDADALAKGLKRGQARLRKAWRNARETEEPMALHDWRKRVKDQAAHLRLLRGAAPSALRARHGEEKKAAELLGEEHDHWLLAERLWVARVPASLSAVRDQLLVAVGERRDALRKEAFKLGKGFSAQKPKALARELTAAWEKASARANGRPRRANGPAISPQP